MEDANPEGDAPALRRAPQASPNASSSKEHPSDIAAIEDEGDEPLPEEPHGLDPRRAYEMLEIRTPLEEFEGYVRARIDTLARLGDSEKAGLTAEALDLGRRAIARVTGVSLPEKAPGQGARS